MEEQSPDLRVRQKGAPGRAVRPAHLERPGRVCDPRAVMERSEPTDDGQPHRHRTSCRAAPMRIYGQLDGTDTDARRRRGEHLTSGSGFTETECLEPPTRWLRQPTAVARPSYCVTARRSSDRQVERPDFACAPGTSSARTSTETPWGRDKRGSLSGISMVPGRPPHRACRSSLADGAETTSTRHRATDAPR